MSRPTLVVLAALLLLVSACIRQGSDGSETGAEALPPEAPELPEITGPVVSALEISPGLVSPGEAVAITAAEGITGAVVVQAPDGTLLEVELAEGTATLALPQEAAEGAYLARLDGPLTLALGGFEVVEGPAVRLSTDRLHPAPSDVVEVQVEAVGIPGDMTALVGSGETDWGALSAGIDTGDDEEDLAVLALHESGFLVPSFSPGRLAELAAAPLSLAGFMAAPLQVVVVDQDTEEFWVSNRVEIRTCERPATLTGELGGGALVRVTSVDGSSLDTASATAGDGSFQLQVAPGWAVISVASLEDGLPVAGMSTTARLGCGSTTELFVEDGELRAREVDTGAEDRGDSAEVPGEDGLPQEGGSVSLTGDLEHDYPVGAICQADDGVLEVILSDEGMEEPQRPSLFLELPAQAGRHSASARVMVSFLGPEAEGPIEVTITLGGDELLPTAWISFRGDYSGEAGSGTMAGEFSCTVLGRLSGSTGGGLWAAPRLVAQAGGGGEEPCRTAVVAGVTWEETGDDGGASGYLAGELERASPRLDVTMTESEMRALLGFEASRQLLGTEANPSFMSEIAGALNADFLVMGNFGTVPGTERSWARFTMHAYRSTDVTVQAASTGGAVDDVVFNQAIPRLVERSRHAALCAEVEPEQASIGTGEEIDFTVEATNLAGEPANGSEVRISGNEIGDVRDPRGTISGGSYEFTYEANQTASGQETLRIEVEGSGPEGTITDRLSVPIEVAGNLVMEGSFALDPSQAEGDLGALAAALIPTMDLRAKACQTGPHGPWTGELHIDASMFGTFAAFALSFADAVLDTGTETGPAPLEATLQVEFTAPEEGGGFPIFWSRDGVSFERLEGMEGWYLPPRLVFIRSEGTTLFPATISFLPPEESCP